MKIVRPLQDSLVGRRVQRVPPYKEKTRSNTGEIIGFFHAMDQAANHPSKERTHVKVRFDDGVVKNCHPSALRVEAPLPAPPRFQTVEQAEAWMAKQEKQLAARRASQR